MPVKVRCPKCEKLLNAPDGARGKAIKCPGCETKIRVPDVDTGTTSGKARVGAKAASKKSVGQDSMEILANIDLSAAADSSASMCPKCGADIPEDATECPNCGVDPTTGLLTEGAKRRQSLRGIDPAKFYPIVWKDSWAFTMENKWAVTRTIIYAVLSYGVVVGCGFMVWWCSRLPPKAFWAGFVVVAWQIFPGWLWHLRVETIKLTISKKRSLRDVHFDIFGCVSLGIKTILWTAIFCWVPVMVLLYPLAMIHMAMPVTKRAWSWPSMLGTFFRNAAPTMYYWVIAFVMDLPLYIAAITVLALFYREGVDMIHAVQKGEQATVRIPFIVVTSIAGVVSLLWFAFAQVFMMRVNALIAYYFRDTLDLVTRIPEKEYVKQDIQFDAFGERIKTPAEKMKEKMIGVIAVIAIVIIAFVIYRQIFPPPAVEIPPDPNAQEAAAPALANPNAGKP